MQKRFCKATFETKQTKQQTKERMRQNWPLWRLVFDGGLDYKTVFEYMTPNQIKEANCALDEYIRLRRGKG